MKPTHKEIIDTVTELQEALLESLEADQAEVDALLRKAKAHKRLVLARDEIRALSFN